MADRERVAELAEMVKAAKAAQTEALKACVAFADAHGLEFEWDTEYGSAMQTYIGKGAEGWEDSNCYGDSDRGADLGGQGRWVSSSDGC